MAPLPLSPPATVFAWSGTRFAGAPSALFALDAQLGEVVRSTRTPIVGQMRLTWWHDALIALGSGPAPAHPVLRDLAADVVPGGVAGAALAPMIDGWEVLLVEDTPDGAALTHYADARGGILFAALAGVAGEEVAAAGRVWALADLAAHVADPAIATMAAAMAIAGRRASGLPRALDALHRDALMAAEGRGVPGGLRRAAAVLRTLVARR